MIRRGWIGKPDAPMLTIQLTRFFEVSDEMQFRTLPMRLRIELRRAGGSTVSIGMALPSTPNRKVTQRAEIFRKSLRQAIRDDFPACCTRLTKLDKCQKFLWNAEYDLFLLKDFRTQKSTAYVFGLTARLSSAYVCFPT